MGPVTMSGPNVYSFAEVTGRPRVVFSTLSDSNLELAMALRTLSLLSLLAAV